MSEKIKENTYDADVDAYGDVLIKRALISSYTVSYFEADEYNARILAYSDSGSKYRLAYDCCQKCENGWFYENGGYLRCSVCGKGIELGELGKENPSSEIYSVPITKNMYEERQRVLSIPEEIIENLIG